MDKTMEKTVQCPKETAEALDQLAQISGFEKANSEFFLHVISKFKDLVKHEAENGKIVIVDSNGDLVKNFEHLIKPGKHNLAKRFFKI